MDDKKLTEIFMNFNPELSSDSLFMNKLKRNLEAVELVKVQTAAIQRKNKLALIIATITGFVLGVISTICYPYISDYFAELTTTDTTLMSIIENYGHIAIWGIISCATMIITYVTYDITLIATKKDLISVKL